MALANVRVTVHEDVIRELLLSGDMRDMLQDYGDEVARIAQELAPRHSGHGARSIHTDMEVVGDDWEAHVSWSWPDAYYLYWHEKGSRQLAPRPFLIPALEAVS